MPNLLDDSGSIETVNIDNVVPLQQDQGHRYRDHLFPTEKENAPNNTDTDTDSSASSLVSEELGVRAETVDLILLKHSRIIEHELKVPTDRLFFSELYHRYDPAVPALFSDGSGSEPLTDFQKYDKEVQIELKLREIFKKRIEYNEFSLKVNVLELDLVPGEDLNFKNDNAKNIFKKMIPDMRRSPSSPVDMVQVDNLSSNTNIIDQSYLEQLDKERQQQLESPVYTTQRKLKSRHLQMIGFSSTIGVGLFLNSGKLFQIAGPLGCLLGYLFGGMIVFLTMLSFCEMVVLIPLADGISGVTSRFVDDAFGFSSGICYWISFALAFPSEVIAGTIMLSYYDALDVPDSKQTVGWVFLFYLLVLCINLMDVRIYLEFEFVLNMIKILFTLLVVIFLIVSNRGGTAKGSFVGFKYWDSNKSPTDYITYGPFRPTFDLSDEGNGSKDGITGNWGRFLSVLTLSLISCYSYSGTEIPCIIAGEVIKPRQLLKSSSKQVFWRIATFYILTIFIVGISIYSGDPRLLRYLTDASALKVGEDISKDRVLTRLGSSLSCYSGTIWANEGNGNQSPFVLLIQYTGYCSLARVFNGVIIVFAISCASSHLYVSSRSLYAMATQGKAPSILKKCWKNGVPYVSVFTSSLFGWLLFLVIHRKALQVFQTMINLISTSLILTWLGLNFAYLRFYYAMKGRPDIVSRDDPQYPYKVPFQPYLLYFGLAGSLVVLLLMGYITFMHGHWDTAFFLTSYGMWIVWVALYLGYKFLRNVKFQKLYNIDLDTGRAEI